MKEEVIDTLDRLGEILRRLEPIADDERGLTIREIEERRSQGKKRQPLDCWMVVLADAAGLADWRSTHGVYSSLELAICSVFASVVEPDAKNSRTCLWKITHERTTEGPGILRLEIENPSEGTKRVFISKCELDEGADEFGEM